MKKYDYIKNGLAMFSMFFGAGNVVFPLLMGQKSVEGIWSANLGLFFTGICLPFLGLMTIILYKGDLRKFFFLFGKKFGYIMIFIIIALIGPFGGIPRCILISYSSINFYCAYLPLWGFIPLVGALLYICCICKDRVLMILGTYLTPVLMVSLAVLVIKGLTHKAQIPPVVPSWAGFVSGLKYGYFTMDLLAGFFFCSLFCDKLQGSKEKNPVLNLLKSAFIGGTLLCVVYCSFSLLSAQYASYLSSVPSSQYLVVLGSIIIGEQGGAFVSIIISLACITTAIALVVSVTSFIESWVFKGRLPYRICLALVILISCIMAFLKFEPLLAFLSPILECIYPLLIVITFYNAYKYFNEKHPKLTS